MVGKNNYQVLREKAARRVTQYGIRRLSVGVASVAISASLLFASQSAIVKAQASELTPEDESSQLIPAEAIHIAAETADALSADEDETEPVDDAEVESVDEADDEIVPDEPDEAPHYDFALENEAADAAQQHYADEKAAQAAAAAAQEDADEPAEAPHYDFALENHAADAAQQHYADEKVAQQAAEAVVQEDAGEPDEAPHYDFALENEAAYAARQHYADEKAAQQAAEEAAQEESEAATGTPARDFALENEAADIAYRHYLAEAESHAAALDADDSTFFALTERDDVPRIATYAAGENWDGRIDVTDFKVPTDDPNNRLDGVTVDSVDSDGTPHIIQYPFRGGAEFPISAHFKTQGQVSEGDYFTIQYPPTLNHHGLGALSTVAPVLKDEKGDTIATGVIDNDTDTVIYTFTKVAAGKAEVEGHFTLTTFIDRHQVGNTGSYLFNPITIAGKEFKINSYVDYEGGAFANEENPSEPYHIDPEWIETKDDGADAVIRVNPDKELLGGTAGPFGGIPNPRGVKVNVEVHNGDVVDGKSGIKIYKYNDKFPDSGIIDTSKLGDEVKGNRVIAYGDYPEKKGEKFTVSLPNTKDRYVILFSLNGDTTGMLDEIGAPLRYRASAGIYHLNNSDPKNEDRGVSIVNSSGNGGIDSDPDAQPPKDEEMTPPEQPEGLQLGDYTWIDADRNGINDENDGDTPLNDVRVILTDADGNVQEQTTGGDGRKDGHYLFTGLKPGYYTVTFEAPEGYKPTKHFAGDDRAVDSNGTQYFINLQNDDLTIDSGFVKEGKEEEPLFETVIEDTSYPVVFDRDESKPIGYFEVVQDGRDKREQVFYRHVDPATIPNFNPDNFIKFADQYWTEDSRRTITPVREEIVHYNFGDENTVKPPIVNAQEVKPGTDNEHPEGGVRVTIQNWNPNKDDGKGGKGAYDTPIVRFIPNAKDGKNGGGITAIPNQDGTAVLIYPTDPNTSKPNTKDGPLATIKNGKDGKPGAAAGKGEAGKDGKSITATVNDDIDDKGNPGTRVTIYERKPNGEPDTNKKLTVSSFQTVRTGMTGNRATRVRTVRA